MQAAQLTGHFGMQIGHPPSLPFESVMGRWIPFVLEDLEDHPAEKTQIRVGKDWILGETKHSDESDPFIFSISRQTSPNSNQTKRIRPFCTRFLIRPMFRSSRAAKFASDHRQENMSVLEQPESFLSFLKLSSHAIT